jgi:hypothetical protein
MSLSGTILKSYLWCGGIHEVKVDQIVDAELLQLNNHGAQVGPKDSDENHSTRNRGTGNYREWKVRSVLDQQDFSKDPDPRIRSNILRTQNPDPN